MIYKAPEVGTTTPYTETSDLCVGATFALSLAVLGANARVHASAGVSSHTMRRFPSAHDVH